MACVTFSALSSIETQTKQQIGVEPNYSDRFIAKLSGTTPQGNYLDKVADTIRLIGVVKEEEWPKPANYTWDSYYADIPQDVINKAQKLNEAYEAISGDKATLQYHLKQCPLQIIVTKSVPTHAVCLVHIEGDTAYYFDSYSPFLKTIPVSNIYNYALKLVLKGQSMARVIREPKGTLRIEFGSGDKQINLGINNADFANQIAQSGEPIIDVPAPATSKQLGIIESGLIIDSE
jgi:hypothetical protein